MEDLIKWVQETISNPVIAGAITVGLSVFGWSIYRALLNVLFTTKNIDNIGNAIKSFLGRIKDPKAKRETELKLAMTAVDILIDTDFADILKPDHQARLKNERSKLLD